MQLVLPMKPHLKIEMGLCTLHNFCISCSSFMGLTICDLDLKHYENILKLTCLNSSNRNPWLSDYAAGAGSSHVGLL